MGITHYLVELHGKIEVASEKDEGRRLLLSCH